MDRPITYISDPIQNEHSELYSKHYSPGGTESVDHNLIKNITKQTKIHNTRPGAQTVNPNPPSSHTTIPPAAHTMDTTTATNNLPKADMQPYPISHTSTKTTAKAYNLRPRKTHHQTTTTHKKKKETKNDNQQVRHAPVRPNLTLPPIKRSLAAQAPPRISMVFPAPCTMPYSNPPNPPHTSSPH
jgi:hypothetical protein